MFLNATLCTVLKGRISSTKYLAILSVILCVFVWGNFILCAIRNGLLADAGDELLVVVVLGLNSGVSDCERTASENKIKPFLKTNADLAVPSSLTPQPPINFINLYLYQPVGKIKSNQLHVCHTSIHDIIVMLKWRPRRILAYSGFSGSLFSCLGLILVINQFFLFYLIFGY